MGTARDRFSEFVPHVYKIGAVAMVYSPCVTFFYLYLLNKVITSNTKGRLRYGRQTLYGSVP